MNQQRTQCQTSIATRHTLIFLLGSMLGVALGATSCNSGDPAGTSVEHPRAASTQAPSGGPSLPADENPGDEPGDDRGSGSVSTEKTGERAASDDRVKPALSCTQAHIKAGFRGARRSAKRERVTEALTAFATLRSQCFASMTVSQKMWLLSDVSLLHHKNGDDRACLDTIGSYEHRWAKKVPKAASALVHNAQLCAGVELETNCEAWDELMALHESSESDERASADYLAEEKELKARIATCELSQSLNAARRNLYREARVVACPLSLPADSQGRSAPDGQGIQLTAEPTRCLDTRGGEKVDVDHPRHEDASFVCPRLTLFERRAGKVQATVLPTPDGSLLQRTGDCCNASILETVSQGSETLVVLRSDGPARDCFGGTATTDEFEVYRWRNGALEQIEALSILLR